MFGGAVAILNELWDVAKRQRRVADCALLSASATGVYIDVNDRARDTQKGRKMRPFMSFGGLTQNKVELKLNFLILYKFQE